MGLPIFLLAMAATMLPTELAYLRLDYRTARSPLRTAALSAGYVAVWTAFATPLFFVPAPPWEIAVAVAALYQLTPLRRACLRYCRTPFARIVHNWRDGLHGAFRTGIENGIWCGGCCAGAMIVILAAGMMSWWWMVVAGAVIFVEKRAYVRWAT